ncbi:MAG: P-type conjugative transfer protein VirB9 [Gammaproteobacteria bacterium]
MYYLVFWVCSILLLINTNVLADEVPKSLSTDKHIKIINYDQNQVVKLKCAHLIATSIQFDSEEKIVGIYIGDQVAWTYAINQQKPNILFIKPTISDSDTNMTVLTNKRNYHFRLIATGQNTPNASVTYDVRFYYPQDIQHKINAALNAKHEISMKELLHANSHAINWHYSYHGSKFLLPAKIFDDGKWTYVKFSPRQAQPAIYAVDDDNSVTLINYHQLKDYIVIQRLAKQFILRNGKQSVCLFNNNYRNIL